MALAGRIQITDQDVRSTSANKGAEKFGQIAATADGRTWAYGANQSTSLTLAPGKLMSGALSVSNHTNRTGTTQKVGDNVVTYTIGNTAITSRQYEDGYLVVNAGTGAGQALLIYGHNTPAGNGSVTVNLKDSIITATSVTDSKYSLVPHPYSAIVISPSASATAIFPVGVPTISIPAATSTQPFSCGWFQVGGPASVLANGTPAVGGAVIPSATTDGAVDVDGASSVQPKVGYMLITAVSTEYRQVWLTINPA